MKRKDRVYDLFYIPHGYPLIRNSFTVVLYKTLKLRVGSPSISSRRYMNGTFPRTTPSNTLKRHWSRIPPYKRDLFTRFVDFSLLYSLYRRNPLQLFLIIRLPNFRRVSVLEETRFQSILQNYKYSLNPSLRRMKNSMRFSRFPMKR